MRAATCRAGLVRAVQVARQSGVGLEVLCGIRGRCEWVGGGRGVLRWSGGGGACGMWGKGDRERWPGMPCSSLPLRCEHEDDDCSARPARIPQPN